MRMEIMKIVRLCINLAAIALMLVIIFQFQENKCGIYCQCNCSRVVERALAVERGEEDLVHLFSSGFDESIFINVNESGGG